MNKVRRKKNRIISDVKSIHSKLDNFANMETNIHQNNLINNQDKKSKVDRNSGLHIVGPMFEMTAVVDRSTSDTFDAIYPSSALTKGPTMCSFGLDYNDHNYALPTGLTPPAMAPHLLDFYIPLRSKFDIHPQFDESLLEVPEESSIPDLTNVTEHEIVTTLPQTESSNIVEQISDGGSEKSVKRVQLKTFNGDESTGLTPVKNPYIAPSKDRDYWANSQQESSRNGKFSEIDPDGTRYRNTVYEGFVEMRCEPERKVVEVPDYLCVSPSKISNLDSDDEVAYEEPFGASGIVNGQNLSASDFPKWFLLRCACNVRNTQQRLIQCTQCQHWQHLDCMMAMYSEIEARHMAVKHHRSGGANVSAANILDALSNGNGDRPSISIVPSRYLCEICGERPVQQSIAVEVQRRIIEELALERAVQASGNNDNTIHQTSLGGSRAELMLSLCDASGSATAHIAGVAAAATVSAIAKSELQWVKKKYGDSLDVNLSLPSPPRMSKRKQDLSTATAVFNRKSESRIRSELASFSSVTPDKFLPTSSHSLGTNATVLEASNSPNNIVSPLATKSANTNFQSPTTAVLASGVDKSNRRPVKRMLFNRSSPLKRTGGTFSEQHSSIGGPASSLFGSAWTKNYREADHNIYSKPLAQLVCERVIAGIEPNYGVPPSLLTRNPLCRVVLFDHHDKGLEAAISICINDVVMEIRGKMMLMEEYEHICDPISVYNRFAIMYRAIHERGIVIDCSQFGNDARFIRRSCNPNCKLDHVIVGGKLHVIIRTICEICPGTELTLPFDIDYRALHYPVECACARSRCSVYKWSKKLVKNKVIPNMDYSKYIETQLRMLSRPLIPDSSWPEPLQLTSAPVAPPRPSISAPISSPYQTPIKTVTPNLQPHQQEDNQNQSTSQTTAETQEQASIDLTHGDNLTSIGKSRKTVINQNRSAKKARISTSNVSQNQTTFQPVRSSRLRQKIQTSK